MTISWLKAGWLKAAAGGGTLGAAYITIALGGCTPTLRVEVAPINIYAKLEADVRIRLDNEVKSAIQQNPNLF